MVGSCTPKGAGSIPAERANSLNTKDVFKIPLKKHLKILLFSHGRQSSYFWKIAKLLVTESCHHKIRSKIAVTKPWLFRDYFVTMKFKDASQSRCFEYCPW